MTNPNCLFSPSFSKMSFSSKPKKVQPKGTVRELKLVHTVNRRGRDTIKTEGQGA